MNRLRLFPAEIIFTLRSKAWLKYTVLDIKNNRAKALRFGALRALVFKYTVLDIKKNHPEIRVYSCPFVVKKIPFWRTVLDIKNNRAKALRFGALRALVFKYTVLDIKKNRPKFRVFGVFRG